MLTIIKKRYPSIMINIQTGVIVLFLYEKKGLVLVANNHIFYKTNEYREDWIMDEFEMFLGEITIKN